MEVQAAEVHPAIWLLGLWFAVVTLSGWIGLREPSRNVTLEETPPTRSALWWEARRLTLWRAASWLMFVVGLDGAAFRAARRSGRIQRAQRRRASDAARDSARALAWERTLASSHSSVPSRPPSAPRPSLDWSEGESTRRWERTLPWGTPSPLLTREGRGKPYPFVPLSPPLPQPSPSSRRRRNS